MGTLNPYLLDKSDILHLTDFVKLGPLPSAKSIKWMEPVWKYSQVDWKHTFFGD